MDFIQEDRDRIIKHDVKLTEVCKTLNKMDKKIDKLNDKIDDNVKTYVNRKIFLSINGIIIALLLFLGGYIFTVNDKVSDNYNQVIENKVNIKQLLK